jgi:DNA-binding PadR family transcriptional regulator
MSLRIDPRTLLLQALIKGPGFGLELLDRVETRSGGQVKLAQAQLYPVLRDLERDGLVEVERREAPPERLGRPRIYYRLTGAGARAALEAREVAGKVFGMVLAPGES